MKIKSYKKLKNNQYKISFKDSPIDLIVYDEIILKYNLLLKKEISNQEWENIRKENKFFACYYKAISYLSYKSRSKKEITEYLKRQKFANEDIEQVVILLEEKKIINNHAFLEMFVNDQIHLTLYGPKKIKKKLIDLGFSEEEIQQSLVSISEDIWTEKLEHIIMKKVKSNKKDGAGKIKEKIVYSCTNEGFSKEKVLEILEKIELPKNNESLLKEVEKLKKKLSLKYSGSVLHYQIKGRLLNKGFSSEDIENALEEV